MLSCRVSSWDAVSGVGCCRFAGWHAGRPVRGRRYPSDATDEQWAVLEPLLPVPACLAGRGGRRESYCRREIVDAIFYVVDNGIKWRALPADFPPWSTVYNYFAAWQATGAVTAVMHKLREQVRLRAGRAAEPTAGIIDSQSVKAAETIDQDTRGYDAGKKINGRKRHIAVDTLGLLLAVTVTAAGIQDRDAARPLLRKLAHTCHRIRLVWADGGYTGKLLEWAATTHDLIVSIVKRSDTTNGFEVLPRRWVVERTLAWITRHRRCARDYERLPQHHNAMICWSQIRIMSQRLTKNQT